MLQSYKKLSISFEKSKLNTRIATRSQRHFPSIPASLSLPRYTIQTLPKYAVPHTLLPKRYFENFDYTKLVEGMKETKEPTEVVEEEESYDPAADAEFLATEEGQLLKEIYDDLSEENLKKEMEKITAVIDFFKNDQTIR